MDKTKKTDSDEFDEIEDEVVPATSKSVPGDDEEPPKAAQPPDDDPLDREDGADEKSSFRSNIEEKAGIESEAPVERDSAGFEHKLPADPAGDHNLEDLTEEGLPPSNPTRDDPDPMGEGEHIPNLRNRSSMSQYAQDSWPASDTNSSFSTQRRSFGYDDKGGYTPHRSRGNKFHILILVLVGAVVIGGTVFMLKGGTLSNIKNAILPQATPAPTIAAPVTTPEPTTTPNPVDRSKFKLRVLNGTPKAGLAASVSAKLKDLGYQIDKTGNATNSAFTQTTIRTKTSANGLVDQLIQDLHPDYEATGTPTLKDSDTDDGEVILGAK